MADNNRLPSGGRIDRDSRLRFLFNGRRYEGHPGDSLASALLANGVSVVGRSILWHRPRGLVAAGADEPNALMQVGVTPRATPDAKATEVELHDGLIASTVNGWPGIGVDLGALAGLLGGLLAAGAAAKVAPPSGLGRRLIAPLRRRVAGWGDLPDAADRDRYDHTEADVLVVGAGAAGLAAARAAARAGLRVVLADEQAAAGGALLHLPRRVEGRDGADWAAATAADLAAMASVSVMTRTRLIDLEDDGEGGGRALLLERRTDHLGPQIGRCVSRQRLWTLRASRVILATGAWQQMPAFAGNDRPGVMLADAVLAYLRRWAVLPARRAAVFTGDDGAYETALALHAAGCALSCIVDTRPDPAGPLVAAARAAGIKVLAGHAVVATGGLGRLRSLRVRPLSADGREVSGRAAVYRCDLLAVSGGWAPDLAPWQTAGGGVAWDEILAAPVPDAGPEWLAAVGAGGGEMTLAGALADGQAAGRAAAADLAEDTGGTAEETPPACEEPAVGPAMPLGLVPCGRRPGWGRQKAFVDLQQDVVAGDLLLAVQDGLEDAAQVARYTGWSLGTEHGRSVRAVGLRLLAEALHRPPASLLPAPAGGPTRPVALGALAGWRQGDLAEADRLTPLVDWHRAAGAVMGRHAGWWRPEVYPLPGEAPHHAVEREVMAVRERVGLFDASSLGKIEIQGADAEELLERVYGNRWRDMGIGRIRYGLMLDDVGMVLDDGTCARLDAQRWLMTTTTDRLDRVLAHMTERLRGPWSDLRVFLCPVTEQWATLTLAGPLAREVLGRLAPDLYLGARAFPFMTVQDAVVAGVPARVGRVGFTGTLTYEISVPWSRAAGVWQAALDAGSGSGGVTPVGLRALEALRTEKGVVLVGRETDGTVSPHDLGYHRMVALDKPAFVGRAALLRHRAAGEAGRWRLVGLLTEDPRVVLDEGAVLVAERGGPPPHAVIGRVTSSCYSPTLARSIALALLADGDRQAGRTVHVPLADRWVTAVVTAPVFVDPEGRKRDG
jgi:sarcosine oxidase subunit alpha